MIFTYHDRFLDAIIMAGKNAHPYIDIHILYSYKLGMYITSPDITENRDCYLHLAKIARKYLR